MAEYSMHQLKQGWKHLCSIYNSPYNHCLVRGCSEETLAYWANSRGGFTGTAKFYRAVLTLAVEKGWAIESHNQYGCRKYKFAGINQCRSQSRYE